VKARRWVFRIGVPLIVGLFGWALVCGLVARSHVARARDRIESLRSHGGDTDAAARALTRAAADLRAARSTMRQPGPAIVSRIPIVGRTFVAIRVIDAQALVVVEAAQPVLDAVRAEPLVGSHRVDVRRLAAVTTAMRDAAQSTKDVPSKLDGLRTGWTPPGVLANVRKARSQLGGVPAGLTRTADLTDALAGILGAQEKRRIMLVLENNAELRGAGGLVSVFAEAVADKGSVEFGPFQDVVSVAESRGYARPVPAPADYVARYGRFLANTTLWRNANMSPDLPTSSTVLAELLEKSTKRHADAVITLDVPAIAAILDATGPVGLPDGRRLSDSNVVDELLSKAYEGVPDTRAGQDERRKRLRDAADAVVKRLFSGDAPAVALAVALGDAAAGRHVALWSARPEEQRAFEAADAAGQVRADGEDLALVAVHNLGGGGDEGNKLDYYARVSVAVKVRVDRDVATVERRYTMRNTAPSSGLPLYVSGVTHPGQSHNLVSFALPADATDVEFSRGDASLDTATQREGGHAVIDDVVDLDPGAEATWVLRYKAPVRAGRYLLRVVPQPLAHDATLRLDIEATGHAWFGEVKYDGAFDRERRIEVHARKGTFWQRLGRGFKHFWEEPVHL
jgi:hypothetical protein